MFKYRRVSATFLDPLLIELFRFVSFFASSFCKEKREETRYWYEMLLLKKNPILPYHILFLRRKKSKLKIPTFQKLLGWSTYSGRRWSWGEAEDPRKEGWWDNFEASVGLAGRAWARWPRAAAPAGRCFRPRSSESRFRATRRTPWPPTTRTWAWWGWGARRDPAKGLRSAPRRKRSASATLPSPSAWSSARDAPSPSLALPCGCWSSVMTIRASFNNNTRFASFSKYLKKYSFLSLSHFFFYSQWNRKRVRNDLYSFRSLLLGRIFYLEK